jgi:hypothetical protein
MAALPNPDLNLRTDEVFIAQFLLDSIRDGVKMIANGLLIQGVGDGEHVF